MSRMISVLLLALVTAVTLLAAAIQVTARPGILFVTLDPMVPGVPADFHAAADAQQVPVIVHGSVKEFGTQAPIAGALLVLTPIIEGSDPESAVPFDIETRTDGSFALKDVPPGQYRVSVVRDGFVNTHSSIEAAKAWLEKYRQFEVWREEK